MAHHIVSNILKEIIIKNYLKNGINYNFEMYEKTIK